LWRCGRGNGRCRASFLVRLCPFDSNQVRLCPNRRLGVHRVRRRRAPAHIVRQAKDIADDEPARRDRDPVTVTP
jgi:hypothetical protein